MAEPGADGEASGVPSEPRDSDVSVEPMSGDPGKFGASDQEPGADSEGNRDGVQQPLEPGFDEEEEKF